jgi:hypothetical protein
MKRTLLTLTAAISIASSATSQVIQNGGMESWLTVETSEPSGWFTSNREGGPVTGVVTSTKSTDSHGGASAIKLESKMAGGELMFGFFVNTDGDPIEGQGGVPYSQRPTHITGWYKSDIVAGDSAIVLVIFKKAGAVVSQDVFTLTGVHSAYTQFSFALTLSVDPDSVIIAAASSNAISEIGAAAGSTVTIDDLAFSGPGITQPIPGGDFETWLATSSHFIEDWNTYGDPGGVARTAGSYKGDYAALLTTMGNGMGEAYGSGITNGQTNNGPIMGGKPYNHAIDTLVFWYKYTPQGNDSAMAFVSLSKNGAQVGGSFIKLGAAATYTKVIMPLSPMMTPDTISINIASSMNGGSPGTEPVEGSMLWVDEVQLTSEPLNTGLRNIFRSDKNLSVYPNPFAESIELNLEGHSGELSYTLNDITGKIVASGKGNTIATGELGRGIYFVTVGDGTQVLAVKKIVKE